jgi:hypothetical protein
MDGGIKISSFNIDLHSNFHFEIRRSFGKEFKAIKMNRNLTEVSEGKILVN